MTKPAKKTPKSTDDKPVKAKELDLDELANVAGGCPKTPVEHTGLSTGQRMHKP